MADIFHEFVRIEGVGLEEGPSLERSMVQIQCTDHKQDLHVLRIPFPEAMMLLTYLRQMQLEQKYPMPEKPVRFS